MAGKSADDIENIDSFTICLQGVPVIPGILITIRDPRYQNPMTMKTIRQHQHGDIDQLQTGNC